MMIMTENNHSVQDRKIRLNNIFTIPFYHCIGSFRISIKMKPSRMQEFMKTLLSYIFSYKLYIFISFLCGYNYDYKNKFIYLLSRIYCACFIVIICYYVEDILDDNYYILVCFNVYILIFTFFSFIGKQTYLAKYLKETELILKTMNSSLVQHKISLSSLLILFLGLQRLMLTYFVIYKYKYFKLNTYMIFAMTIIYGSLYMPCVSIVLVYDLFWKQIKIFKEMLHFNLIENHSNNKCKMKILKTLIQIYQNILNNMDGTIRVIGGQVLS